MVQNAEAWCCPVKCYRNATFIHLMAAHDSDFEEFKARS
jgi:hypothetical protein